MSRLSRALALAAGLLLVASCEPADRSGDVDAWVFARSPGTDDYHLKLEALHHLTSLRELSGRDVVFRRGTVIDQGFDGRMTFERGFPFALEYSVDDAGHVVAGDEDSFYALTLYRNLDDMASLLRAHGYAPERPLTVYFLPRYDSATLGDGRLFLTDNEAFVSEARGFLILPAFLLADLPMTLNEGVIAHEFGHSVIHQLLFGDAPDATNADSTDPAWTKVGRHLAAMHEGVADLFGFVKTGEPDFIGPTAEVDRDLSVPRSLTPALEKGLDDDPPPDDLLGVSFDPHVTGSILARTVYELWPKDSTGHIDADGRGALLDAVLATLRTIHDEGLYSPTRKFSLATFPNELVLQLPAEERAAACAVLDKRLAPLADRLTNCEGG